MRCAKTINKPISLSDIQLKMYLQMNKLGTLSKKVLGLKNLM